jgi:hypothetical protein
MMDEVKLIEKLRLIEALFSGATTEGEREAAARARERILERLKQFEKEDPPVEYRFTMGDMWSRKVFVALLRRYGIRPYRYSGQRHTTVMARVSKRFVDETLWPEFEEISGTLKSYLSEVTERIVAQVIHGDSSEAEVVDEPAQLPASTAPSPPSPLPVAPAAPKESSPMSAASAHPSSSDSSASNSSAKNRKKRQRKSRKH